MSNYSPNKFRKRRSDDESSDSDGDIPPLKKRKPEETNLKQTFTSKCHSIYKWFEDFPANFMKKRTIYPIPIVDVTDDDIEDPNIISVDDDMEIVDVKFGATKNSFHLPDSDSPNGFPKPKNTSTPFYRDGTMVGYKHLSSTNGYHSKNPKTKDHLRKSQKQPRSNNRCIAPITNPGIDIEILLDSREISPANSEELEIVSEISRGKRSSKFSKPSMSPITIFDGASSVQTSDTSRRGLMNGDPTPSTSRQNSTTISKGTVKEVIRLEEKERYEELLKNICLKSSYRPLVQKKVAIQVDLTQDEDEESLTGLPFSKEYLQKPIGDFIEKYYKPCRLVTQASRSNSQQKIPLGANEDRKENTAAALPQYKRKITAKPNFFEDNWIKELKTAIDEETNKRLLVVKQQEDKIKRYSERRDAKFEQEKILFEKYKVPGDVFPYTDQNDYPDFTAEMECIINSGLQEIRGFETEEMCSMNGVTILRKHLTTLHGTNWLIDEILNFYLNLIVERSKNDNYPSAYTYNTFFYSSLKGRGIQSVLRWTRKVDIFSYDIVFVPLHLEVHWALCVIDNRSKTVKYYDSMNSNHTNQQIKYIHDYLIAEKKAKKNIVMDPDEYKMEIVKNLPKQMNGSDCGMFTLKYAEYISRDAPITFEQEHINYFRRRMVYEILTKQLL